MADATVSAGYARALIAVAVARGAEAEVLAQQAELSADQLDDPDARVPFARFKALMLAAKALCNDPAFGLHFGAE